MINHFITTLYNRVEPSPEGVYVPLPEPLPEPPVLAGALQTLRGNTPESAWAFAVSATKMVDASTYQSEITTYDERLTYELWQLRTPGWNAVDLMTRIRSMPPAALNLVLDGRKDLARSFRRVDIFQESVAAVLVGIVQKVTEFSNGG